MDSIKEKKKKIPEKTSVVKEWVKRMGKYKYKKEKNYRKEKYMLMMMRIINSQNKKIYNRNKINRRKRKKKTTFKEERSGGKFKLFKTMIEEIKSRNW